MLSRSLINPLHVAILIILTVASSLNAKEFCVRPNMERELPYFAKPAESIVVAEYVGYSILPLTDQEIQEQMPNFPVRSNYKTVEILKGPKLPAFISVKSNYHFARFDKDVKRFKVSNWSEPTIGSKWILYLKSVDPKLLKNEGYKPIIGNYTFGLEYNQNNLDRTLRAIKK